MISQEQRFLKTKLIAFLSFYGIYQTLPKQVIQMYGLMCVRKSLSFPRYFNTILFWLLFLFYQADFEGTFGNWFV
jgi:predicted transposase YdaD